MFIKRGGRGRRERERDLWRDEKRWSEMRSRDFISIYLFKKKHQ
jgi:hypothetical protein